MSQDEESWEHDWGTEGEWPLLFAVRSDAADKPLMLAIMWDDTGVPASPLNLFGSTRTRRRSDRDAWFDLIETALDGVLDYARRKRSGFVG